MDNSSDIDRNNIRKTARLIQRARLELSPNTAASIYLKEALKSLALVCDINKPVKKEITVKGNLLLPEQLANDLAKLLKKELKQ